MILTTRILRLKRRAPFVLLTRKPVREMPLSFLALAAFEAAMGATKAEWTLDLISEITPYPRRFSASFQ